MNPHALIPAPDVIPAPAPLFHVLDVALFTLHILIINIVLGGTIILLVAHIMKNRDGNPLHSALATKLPVGFALGINLGVAPLLFLQVIYGHLFYTSSVLMGVYWILIIPLLIIAYYAAYIHAKTTRTWLAGLALLLGTLILLYVSFMLVNNNLMMMQPATWNAYFANRDGTILMTHDPTLVPRYLHFVLASVAIAGLASSTVWVIRRRKGGGNAEGGIRQGLRIFGFVTMAQVVIGLWFLLALPREIMLQFMGRDILATILFVAGFLATLGAIMTAMRGHYRPTLIMAIATVFAMILMREQLRLMYLDGVFSTASLTVEPQYGVLALFLVILVAGLAAVGWMLRAGFRSTTGRAAS